MPVCEPTTDQGARQPLTPSNLQLHSRAQESHGKSRGKYGQHHNKTKTNENGLRVLLFERIEEEFVPTVDRDGCAEVREKKEDDGDG